MSEPKYIDADEFVKDKREWYCEQCLKRKGMKRGKLQFVYEIGELPCRACDVDDVISDIEDFPAADVEPVRHGRWVWTDDGNRCNRCLKLGDPIPTPYCPHCGARMEYPDESEVQP